ncbi:MAG: recombinase family protein [Oscillospiraceae bacterium]
MAMRVGSMRGSPTTMIRRRILCKISREICRAFAEKSGWTIVGSSADNNISGMNFSRRGLDMLTAAVQAKQVDAVLVKDLSRLGRHRTQNRIVYRLPETAASAGHLRNGRVWILSAKKTIS